MSAEERWADRMEWAEERRRGFDTEIKIVHDVAGHGLECESDKCKALAVKNYNIGPVADRYFTSICLCADHDDEETAFEIYRDTLDYGPDED